MAKKVKFPPQRDEIPPWFMTYSDVITLLMTFFILLLTFSTTEPEKFDRVERSITKNSAATGVTGVTVKGLSKDAWISRVRPPAARIALRGAEMPPIMDTPPIESFGKGLEALAKTDQKQPEWTKHYFDVELNRLLNDQGEITTSGQNLCASLAKLLQDIPFQATIQFSDPAHAQAAARLTSYLIDAEGARPGQLGLGIVRTPDLGSRNLRIVISRYVGSP
ncbi:MAG TPA: flagellar motor protein MotB [Pirellulaceae bacterium]|nr:flagellar motor protein MotB [Pirellulaceae bacterium]